MANTSIGGYTNNRRKPRDGQLAIARRHQTVLISLDIWLLHSQRDSDKLCIRNIYIRFDIRAVYVTNHKVLDWVRYGKIDVKETVDPGSPEFFGLDLSTTKAFFAVRKMTCRPLRIGAIPSLFRSAKGSPRSLKHKKQWT